MVDQRVYPKRWASRPVCGHAFFGGLVEGHRLVIEPTKHVFNRLGARLTRTIVVLTWT